MTNEVIKKDGTKEPFNADKIRNSIRGAAQRADIPEERKDEVIREAAAAVIQSAEREKDITTDKIREKILNELDSIEPAVSAAWREYEETKKNL